MVAPSVNSTLSLNSVMSRLIVIKLGTSSIIDEMTHDIRYLLVSGVASTVAALRVAGFKVVIVSSGAVGMGLQRMGFASRPDGLPKQALAAIGQGEMMSMWSNIFAQREIAVAQVLLTHDDISSPERQNNAVRTLDELLSLGVVPIVNEDDTSSTKEIRIGDNDTLGAIVAAMIHASYLFLLTDVDSLYASNPKRDAHALRIDLVPSIDSLKYQIDSANLGAGSANGTGGMATKLRAAEIASAAGIFTVITSSSRPSVVSEILEYYNDGRRYNLAPIKSDSFTMSVGLNDNKKNARPLHTLFSPNPSPRLPPLQSLLGTWVPPLSI